MTERSTNPAESVVASGRGITHAPAVGLTRRLASKLWLTVLFFLARRMPWVLRRGRAFFTWGTWTFSRLIREGTLTNARRILGEGSTPRQRYAIARATVGSFYDFVCDVGWTLGASREELNSRIAAVEGREAYDQARSLHRGAIIATAHMGSFEVGMAALLHSELRIHVVFQRDREDRFEQLRTDVRSKLGIVEAPVGEGLGKWLELRDALLRDEVVAIQADRVMPGQKGQKVLFLGGHMMVPAGPVKLAMITGAPIIPIFSIRQPDGRIVVKIEQPIYVESGRPELFEPTLLQLAEVMAKQVRLHPGQWLVLHKAWCEDLD